MFSSFIGANNCMIVITVIVSIFVAQLHFAFALELVI